MHLEYQTELWPVAIRHTVGGSGFSKDNVVKKKKKPKKHDLMEQAGQLSVNGFALRTQGVFSRRKKWPE